MKVEGSDINLFCIKLELDKNKEIPTVAEKY